MAEPFIGEIRMMSFNFAPKGWAQCNGQLMPINQNQALFSVLGTNYGGNGQTNFGLPNLQGRVPLHAGSMHATPGTTGGAETHTLTLPEMPQHVHFLRGNEAATGGTPDPTNNFPGGGQGLYHAPDGSLTTMRPAVVSNVGGNQPHENRQPYTVINFSIALQGIFPSVN